jgi:hypothetical protein
MANTKLDQASIRARLNRLDGLTLTQRTSLAQVLNPLVVESISDSLLAAMVSAQLPTLPLNPDQGLPLGLPGAVQPARFVGGTVNGAPSTGIFEIGDFVISRVDGALWVCTTAGTPGIWHQNGGGASSTTLSDTQIAQVDARMIALLTGF